MRKILQLLTIVISGVSFIGNSNAQQCDTILIASTLCTNSSVLVTLGDQSNTDCLPSGGGVGYTWAVNQIMGGPTPNITDNDDGTATIGNLGSVVGGFAIQVEIDPGGGPSNDYIIIDTFTIVEGVEVPTVDVVAPNCLADGSATISGYDGTLDYAFSPLGPSVDGTGVISGASFGQLYALTAENTAGCVSDASSFTVEEMLPTPAAPTVDVVAPNCLADGSATISGYDGTLDYAFSPLGPSVDGTGVISGASFGQLYALTAENTEGCVSDASSFTVEEMLPTPAAPTVDVVAPNCLADGSATISGYDGTLDYAFSPLGPSVDGTGVISGASFGQLYALTAENTAGCVSDATSFTVEEMLPAPAAPTVDVVAPNCLADGSATISGYDGTLDYAFSPLGPSVDGTGVISGASFGQLYALTAENTEGCVSDASSFTVEEMLPTPAAPTVDVVAPNCLADGSATISGYDGTLDYAFSPLGPSVDGTGVISGASFGQLYALTAENTAGCVSDASSFTVEEMLPTPAAPTVDVVAPNCLADGSATISGYDGTLDYAFSPLGPSVDGTGVISGASFGQLYALTAENTEGCVSDASSFTVEEMLPTPAITNSETMDEICSGSSSPGFILTSSPSGATFSWTSIASGVTGNTASGSGNIPMDVLTGDGTVTYSVTPTLNGCEGATVNFVVTVNPLPNLEIAGSTSFCLGSSTTLTAQEPGGGDPGWTFLWSDDSKESTLTVTEADTYSVTVTDGNGCTAEESVEVDQLELLMISISPSIGLELCGDETQILSAPADPNYSYLWSPGNETSSAINAGAGQYSVTVTDNSVMCTGEASITVIANDRPTAVLSAPITEYCVGDPGPDITVTLTGDAPFDFEYTRDGANPTNVNGVNGSTYTITGAVQGTYEIISLNDNNCPSILDPVSNSIEIIENPLPTVSITPAEPAFCPGSSVVVTAVGTFTTVTWKKGSFTIGMGNSITISEAGTDYSVEVEDGKFCRNTLNFSVEEQNNVEFEIQAVPGTSICPGEVVTLDAGNFDMYVWSPGNETTQTIEINQAGMYSCTVTDSNGCTGSNSIDIAAENTPIVSSPPTDQTLEYCEGSAAPNVVFELEGEAPFTATYSFNNGPDQNATAVGNIITIASASAGTYRLTSISDANCSTLPGFESTVVTVQENARPDFEIASSSGEVICPSETTTLSATESFPAGYTYSWSGPAAGTNPTLSTNIAGTYTLLITSDKGCFSTDDFELTESDLSTLFITTDDDDNSICIGQESVTLTVNGASSFIWQDGVGSPNENNLEVSPSSMTTYTAELTNNDGCVAERSVAINVFTPPTPVIFNLQDFYCEGSTIQLNTEEYADYLWSNQLNTQSISPTASFDNGNDPTYAVTVTDENGCTGSDSETVSVRELPTAGISTLSPPVQTAFVIDFNVVDADFDTESDCTNPGDLSYVWNFSNSAGSPVLSIPSDNELVQYTFDLPDTVISEVALTVLDGCGCVSAPITSPYSVIPNGSCGASIAFPVIRCINDVLTFDAEPKVGNPAPNKIFEEGYFIIENVKIRPSDVTIDDVITSNDKQFIVRSISSIDETNANDVIEVEFTEAISYAIRYYVDYGACERTTPINNFKINALPSFDSFEVDVEACANENHVASFVIENNNFNYQFDYTLGIDDLSKVFNQISTKTIPFANLPEGTTQLTFGALTDTKTSCVNEEYANTVFDLVKLSPLELIFTDTCNTTLDSIEYTLNITGSTGNYNVKFGTETFAAPDSIFQTGPLVPGIPTQFTVTDTGCDNPVYSVVESYDNVCDECYPIQQISDNSSNELPTTVQLCEGERYEFAFSNTFEDEILDQHKIVYAIQTKASSIYTDSIIVFEEIKKFDGGIDPRFTFEFGMDTLKTDVEYFLSAYLVLNVQGDTLPIPFEGCPGLTPISLRWNSNANSTIGLLQDEDGIACQQEIDFQLFILTDPADDLKQVSYEWSSSGNVEFSPENLNVLVEGERAALAIFGSNPAGPLEIYLNQSYAIPGRTCNSTDTLELQILDILSPSEDTIIGFPGDLFTFPVSGLCYQWGLQNEELENEEIDGETTQYLALENGLGNNVLWIDISDCRGSDPDTLCVTRVYYNAPEPPKLTYKPNENLDIKLIPNPNNGQFTLDFFGDQGGQLEITVVNSTGIPVKRIIVEKERRFQKESFNLMNIDAGLYFIQVIDEGGYRHVLKFVKR